MIWRSKKQNTVAHSTTEAEYVTLSFAARQSIWVNRGLSHLGINTKPVIYGDNTASIKLTSNQGVSDQTKHIDVRHHHIRELVEQREIEIGQVGTKDNIADICTKGLTRDVFEDMLVKLGMET